MGAPYVPPHLRPAWLVQVFRNAQGDVTPVAEHADEADARAAYARQVAHMRATGDWAWVELLDPDRSPAAFDAVDGLDEVTP